MTDNISTPDARRESRLFDKSSLSEQVEEALREEIILGRLRPNQRFSIADYQDAWNISVTPFRDAVRSLEQQGFVVVEPRKGVYVSSLDRHTIKEIFELRIALECMAAELATPLVPEAEASRVLAAYREAQARARDGDRSLLGPTDRSIHDLARNHCGNRRLQRVLAAHRDLIRWVQNALIHELPAAYEEALPEHIEITEAVCARNSQLAASLMRKHLENSLVRLENTLNAQANGDDRGVQE